MSGACSLALLGSTIPLPLVLAFFTLLGVAIPLVFNFAFMSRKDRTDAAQTRFLNTKDLLATQTDRRNDFTAALSKAVKKTKPSIDDIHAVMKTGEAYFETLKLMAQAVLDGRVSDSSRDYDFVPKIAEALLKNIPLYYKTLADVCARYGLDFEGTFKADNYESLFQVLDQFDRESWNAVRHNMETAAE